MLNLKNPIQTIVRWLKLSVSQSTSIDLMGKELEQIFNFHLLPNRIATAGQPTAAQFQSVKASGYRTVINLAPSTHEKALANEAEIVTNLGLEYIHIPVKFDRPESVDFDRFCQVVRQHDRSTLFVHCAANLRVSSFIYLYRRLYEHCPDAEARLDLDRLWTPNPVWQEFIDRTLAGSNN